MIFIIKRNVMIVTKKDILETMGEKSFSEDSSGTSGVDSTSGSSLPRRLINKGFDWLNSKIKKVGDAIASRNENLTIEVIDELFSIHEECENPSFFISKDIKNFGEPMMEKSGDCYQVAVNPKYKDLSFVFETIKEMYDNNEFSGMLSESEVVCEECLEINVEKKLLENMDVWMSKYQISEDVMYHLNNSVPLLENIYRPGSKKHAQVIKETRELWESGALKISELSVVSMAKLWSTSKYLLQSISSILRLRSSWFLSVNCAIGFTILMAVLRLRLALYIKPKSPSKRTLRTPISTFDAPSWRSSWAHISSNPCRVFATMG